MTDLTDIKNELVFNYANNEITERELKNTYIDLGINLKELKYII